MVSHNQDWEPRCKAGEYGAAARWRTSPLPLLNPDTLGQYFARQLLVVKGVATKPARECRS